MNRFNNKKYYKPPPVKPSNRLREKPKEEWNPYKSDLNKYKLTNAEILKKKINATSKNLEEAKRDWQGQIAMIQNGKIKMNFDDDMEGKQKVVRKKIDLTPLAETWECSVHPDGPSYIANGEFKGLALVDVLKQHPEYIGTKVEDGKLPVLVKFIDAKKDLSVQVHPSDDYAKEHEGDNGKTEMWYVVDAEEGAHLIYGFQHEVTEEILRKAVETGTLDKHLQKVEVHKGDTYFVPAGTVHGIGKGILVAEIQESSNVTYRVYDYNRVDKNGKMRELHFDKAVQVMDMSVAPDVSRKPRMVKHYPGCSREILCRCKYFETEKIQVTKGFSFSVRAESFQVLMCLDGYGQVETMDADQKPMRFCKGETLFLPAGLGRCLVVGDAELIKVRC